MNTDRHLDPPDFETIEEILEGCFTQQQAREFTSCWNFIKWHDNDTCDGDLSPMCEAQYKACVENADYILDSIKSNCQGYDLADADIIDHILYVGR